jgi:3-dehydroquinate synthase
MLPFRSGLELKSRSRASKGCARLRFRTIKMKSAELFRIEVRSRAGDYAVLCQEGLLRRAEKLIKALGSFSSVHILSSPHVWKAIGKSLRRGFSARSVPQLHLLNDSETAKRLATVETASRSLTFAGADRQSLVIAVGGGVIGDVAGFVAASYLRGISLVQVPTTLVAQVDSAVGGKTGVNLPEGKNLVGAFYPAKLVIVDPQVLGKLPERQFRSGLAEVIKYGIIADEKLLAFVEENLDDILARKPAALQHIIRRSIEIKARVVSQDERETGLREILNFGHTFGHALESITKYKTYLHGEAVAWGMICAALLGHEVADLPADDAARIISLVRRVGPLPPWPKITPSTIMEAMRADKKTRDGKLRFVLASKIGTAQSYENAPETTVVSVLKLLAKFPQRPEEAIGNRRG